MSITVIVVTDHQHVASLLSTLVQHTQTNDKYSELSRPNLASEPRSCLGHFLGTAPERKDEYLGVASDSELDNNLLL